MKININKINKFPPPVFFLFWNLSCKCICYGHCYVPEKNEREADEEVEDDD